ncbi:DUF2242 domain-containing protein [Paraburkholderia sp. CNPSo 3076]|uniref:DUF2242 domain-containing protein n=1 Tax=Paraburkholderia sp. CNPSo 3076 TaxID=2940936 RepID=UPI0022597FAD|nr:DUF2242 domain-containing protein [Paraburkholderia sp. CNPSo 3076]MCX5538868.1 DUF2242 domain-containing protein [Paraburkholderia sp. CNPSo 3076]
MSAPLRSAVLAVTTVTLAAALGACSSPKPGFQEDQLLSTAPSQFSRSFSYASADACESSRRALLSQGYMTTMTRNDTVDATKNFQPTMDQHIVVEVHVVCTPGDATNTSMVYVNAVQNGYALKKSDTSASVGLSILGSVSLPIRSNSDEMVKISSETIQSGPFYSRFFDLVGKYLNASARSEPVPGAGAIKISPLPPPIEPVTASAAPAATTVGSAAPAAAAAAAATGAAVLHGSTLPAAPVVTAPSVAPAPASAPATATPAPAASAPSASAPVDHGAAAATAIIGVPATVAANPQAAGLAASVTTHNAATPVAASAAVAASASVATAQTLASASTTSGTQSVAAESATPAVAAATPIAAPAASTPSP